MTQPRPSPATIVLLDVDGVLNACDNPQRVARNHRDQGSDFADFTIGQASIVEEEVGPLGDRHILDERTYNIVYSPKVGAHLRRLHLSGLVEIRWLTTWAESAPTSIAPLVGLPLDLAVVASPPVRTPDTHLNTQEVKVDTYSFGPSGEPQPEKVWWKLAAVREVLEENPDAVIVWVDDDLPYDSAAVELVNSTDRLFAIAPQTHMGLTSGDLHSIEKISYTIARAQKDTAC